MKEIVASDIGRYRFQWQSGRWLRYGPWLATPCYPRFFREPRLVFQLIRNISLQRRLVATYLDKELYSTRNTASIILEKDAGETRCPKLLYFLAVCNSALANYWYSAHYQSTYISLPSIQSLPIYSIDFTTPAEEREELLAAGTTEATEWIEATEKGSVKSVKSVLGKRSIPFSRFSGSDVARWLDQRLSADPEQADVVHDLLAHLAERMIAMHEEEQERVEAFWLDLEGVTDPDTFEDLREHGKWEASLWKAEPCRPFVDQNSRSTRHLDESLAWNEACFKAFVKMLAGKVANLSDLVGVYRKHHPTYRQLVGRIAATDRLIDLIVYRLYGLTEEEVAVVEGSR